MQYESAESPNGVCSTRSNAIPAMKPVERAPFGPRSDAGGDREEQQDVTRRGENVHLRDQRQLQQQHDDDHQGEPHERAQHQPVGSHSTTLTKLRWSRSATGSTVMSS